MDYPNSNKARKVFLCLRYNAVIKWENVERCRLCWERDMLTEMNGNTKLPRTSKINIMSSSFHKRDGDDLTSPFKLSAFIERSRRACIKFTAAVKRSRGVRSLKHLNKI